MSEPSRFYTVKDIIPVLRKGPATISEIAFELGCQQGLCISSKLIELLVNVGICAEILCELEDGSILLLKESIKSNE